MIKILDANELGRYVVGYVRTNLEWPTVRQCAARFRVRQSDIEDCANDGGDFGLMLTGYNFDLRLGDLYVEACNWTTTT